MEVYGYPWLASCGDETPPQSLRREGIRRQERQGHNIPNCLGSINSYALLSPTSQIDIVGKNESRKHIIRLWVEYTWAQKGYSPWPSRGHWYKDNIGLL